MNSIDSTPPIQSAAALSSFLKTAHGYDLNRDAPPVDVDRIAELLGICVSEEPRHDAEHAITVGKITLEKDQPARVWINPAENAYGPRRRFTLAHEIGHFCMHRSTNQTTFVDTKATMNRRESFWNRFESEANNFAAELLMPGALITSAGRGIIDQFKADNDAEMMPITVFVQQMASRFKVSNLAMEYRIKNMGIKGQQATDISTT
ncbi:ImmA/IrrE family metallo-endopeptidase [Massilia antarctica]|uniref:ImmA/IrrE family metallo-endopeptidase n=1 Tax=Massilia antarctica TaxID=2765360 RepID=A0AA49A908_9BURK|nr:ImmA/IrrE family metallo-endopeptidase [Massilia antarctica]QPI50731.1 ImmA/IrrE family metallo-endopeptidase [Massilia antarctica]